MPRSKGYPKKAGKVKGRRTYRMHKGGKKYTRKQVKLYFLTGGFKRMGKATRLRRRKRRL